MKAEEILRTAADLVSGPRAEQHGDVMEVFGTATSLFHRASGEVLDEWDGIMFMVCLKIARIKHGTFNVDDYIDACGYLALAGQVYPQVADLDKGEPDEG
jgi:hypothetical protein